MDFNLEYYRVFYYVAKFSSITKAAEILYLTQPAVSRSIKKMEEHMGCRLFRRMPKGMLLTREGEVLYEHISAAFAEISAGEHKVYRYAGYETGELFIGATETALYNVLLPHLKTFRERFPNIRIILKGFTTDGLWENLKTAAIDVAFIVSPLPPEMNSRLFCLMEFQDVFVAGPEFSELRDRTLTPRELLDYPIVCLEHGTSARRHLDDWCKVQGLTLEPEYSVLTTTLALPFVENSLAIGVMPHDFIARSVVPVFQVSVTKPISLRQLYLAVNEEIPMSAVCREFIQSIVGTI